MAKVSRWYAKDVIRAAEKEAERRVGLAVVLVRDEVKRLINVGNPTGDNPSAEGEPPHKVSARLFNSIAGEVIHETEGITGYVGTNVEYARRLEQGFHGTDSLGRHYDQGERPYLRRALFENKDRVKKILGAE